MSEARFTLRRLARHPGFVLICVLTLALAIGVNVAIFSVVRGVLLEPLPYPDSDRVVEVSHAAPGLNLDDINISVPLYLRYRERAFSFTDIGLLRTGSVTLTGIDAPKRLREGRVTASLFRVFGVAPLRGRTFSQDDERRGAAAVTLISERLWRGQFGGDADILGRVVVIDGTDVWLPLVIAPEAEADHLASFGTVCIARLRDRVDVTTAFHELKRITDRIVQEFPGEPGASLLHRAELIPRVEPILEVMVGVVVQRFAVGTLRCRWRWERAAEGSPGRSSRSG